MDARTEDQLISLITGGHAYEFEQFLKGGIDVNHYFSQTTTTGYRGKTLLQLAVLKNSINIVELLIGYKCNVNRTIKIIQEETSTIYKPFKSRRSLQYTGLYTAICALDSDMVRVLVQGGADVNLRDTLNCNALWHAVDISTSMVRAILNAKDCDVDGIDRSRASPLHVAALRNNVEVLTMLIKRGATIDIPQLEGASPLCAACKQGCLEAVVCLLQHGANPDGSASQIKDFSARSVHNAQVRPMTLALTHPKSPKFTYNLVTLLADAGATLPPNLWVKRAIPAIFAINYEETYKWLLENSKDPMTLKMKCANAIRDVLRNNVQGTSIHNSIEKLTLPKQMKKYLGIV